MSCTVNISCNDVNVSLAAQLGENTSMFNQVTALITNEHDSEKFDANFAKYVKERTGMDLVSIPASRIDEVVKTALDYNNLKHADVNYGSKVTRIDESLSHFGYTSIDARDFAIRHCGSLICIVDANLRTTQNKSIDQAFEEYNKKRAKDKKKPISKTDYLYAQVLNGIKRDLITRAERNSRIDAGKVKEAIKNNDIIALEKLFNTGNPQDQNLLALYKEALSNRNELIEQIKKDSRLGNLRFDKDDQLSEDDAFEETEEGEETETEDDNDDAHNVDHYIKNLTEKLGDEGLAMTHLPDEIRSYLNSLRRLNSESSRTKVDEKTGKVIRIFDDYDIDNELGVSDTLDAETCMYILYGYGSFINPDIFVESVKQIANDIPGFQALHKFASDMELNPDFKYKCYRIFGKFVISKTETTVKNGNYSNRTINRTSDKRTALRFEYQESAKISSICTDASKAQKRYEASTGQDSKYDILKKSIEQTNKYENDKSISSDRIEQRRKQEEILAKEVANEVFSQLKEYYPTLSEGSILNFVFRNNKGDILGNIDKLFGVLRETINAGDQSYRNYIDIQAEFTARQNHNRRLRVKAIDEDKKVDTRQLQTFDDLYTAEYLSPGSKTAAFQLADLLIPYTHVKLQLNHRNAEGNLSSDVINNSMITNMLNTLQSGVALDNFGKYRFQSQQYDFSNIMLEHSEKDEKGNVVRIINYGLFKYNDDGVLVQTSYARDLLRTALFNGANNMDNSSTALYSQMTKGDYIATAFVNFFNVEPDYNIGEVNGPKTFANYFMRTPSDAPKNFAIRAPRYTVVETQYGSNDGLYIIENIQQAEGLITQFLNRGKILIFNHLLDRGYEADKVIYNYVPVSLAQYVKHIVSDKLDDININDKNIQLGQKKEGSEVEVLFTYKHNDQANSYILKGTYSKKEGRTVLKNPQFVSYAETMETEVKSELRKATRKKLIEQGVIKRKINTSHPIYRQLENMFMQELTDMAVAIDVMFENENGMVRTSPVVKKGFLGDLIWKSGFANDTATARRLYKGYHYNGKTPITVDKFNRAKLTGRVFKSDRFTIVNPANDKVLRNYGQEILDEAFDVLYGEASYIHTRKENGRIVVELTDEQRNKIQEKLIEFIEDYTKSIDERIEPVKKFMPQYLVTEDKMLEFALNYRIACGMFNDIFEGDTKFYKSAQDFFKRAKEVQGSGVPYGIVDYNIDLTRDLDINSIATIKSSLDEKVFKIKDANGNVIEKTIQLRKGFRAVTIKNTVRTSDNVKVKGEKYQGKVAEEDGELVKKLTEQYRRAGFGERAREMAVALMSGWGGKTDAKSGHEGTTVNDAQSYITFEEWIRRITARGQLQQYLPLIEAIYDESKEIPKELLDNFVQVQKNFYYDLHFDADTRSVAPRQIKNAEFVIVPRFVRGTQLEQVADLMEKFGIDQLNTEETSKASKKNVLTLWNDEGEITEENLQDFVNNAEGSREVYCYNYLYTQQETPQHMNAQNKAGIQFMKKILDNIDPNNKELQTLKELFMNLYSSKIVSSFNKLMDELNISFDENGHIKTDEYGNIVGLDYKIFFKKLEEEVNRLGSDSNMLDYVTIDEVGAVLALTKVAYNITKMPTYFSNKSSKLENIAQSMFNSFITRQRLPGFHAAQITSVGFQARTDEITYRLVESKKGTGRKEVISKEEYDKLNATNKRFYLKQKGNIMASKELRFHPNGENYIEVMLPASAFGLEWDGTEEHERKLIKQLEEKGLDKIIGYRIPTEGKQSICVMKITHFVHSSLGSTIVVPDDWVTQTGSDFDIDSVYGITFKTFINKKTGEITAPQYSTEPTLTSYFNYINKRLRDKEKYRELLNKKDEKAKKREEINKSVSDDFKELTKDESYFYHNLPEEAREIVKSNQTFGGTGSRVKEGEIKSKTKQEYLDQMRRVNEALQKYSDETEGLTLDDKQKIDDYIATNEDLIDFVEKSSAKAGIQVGEAFAKIDAERLESVEQLAKENGLPTYEEYQKLDHTNFNSEDACNNKLLETAIKILSNDDCLEENLSRSQFESVIDARDKSINPKVKQIRESRSCYDFFDQADAQEDAMSGAKLKAFSVTRDTFCSVCNTARPIISDSNAVTIIYREEDGFNLEDLQKSFTNVREIEKGVYAVTHNTIGHSKNNRNVKNQFITTYSSQTTAHILDAVKEGAIPNVNDLTFGVYKLFPDIGSDFETGVAFIMQPGVTRIVDKYNSTKSIYSKGKSNPVNAAIREIAIEILQSYGADETKYKRKTIEQLLNEIEKYGDIQKMFAVDDSKFHLSLDNKAINMLTLSASRLVDRLKNKNEFSDSSPVGERNKLLFDLAIILQYNKLSQLSNTITSYTRVCNPDKFGAKQSIYATRKIFNDIRYILNTEENFVLKVGDKHFLQAIYPGFDDTTTAEEFAKAPLEQSIYPPLYNFLKYASATSVIVNQTLFVTQDEGFQSSLESIETMFTGRNQHLTEKQHKNLEDYILSELYNNTTAVKAPITYRPGVGFVIQNPFQINAETLIRERSRIFGFTHEANFDFEVEDLNYPTKEEIDAFRELTPAQKVIWIQRNFEKKGIFEYIDATLSSDTKFQKSSFGAQVLEFKDNTVNIETIYNLFEKAYYSSNPLVALAALDLVKYSFAVEGFRMKKNGLNRVIKNSVLMDTNAGQGTSIVAETNESIVNLSQNQFDIRSRLEYYIRSHFKELKQIDQHLVEKNDERAFELKRTLDNIIVLDTLTENDLELLEKYSIANVEKKKKDGQKVTFNKYVKLNFGKQTTLYKIIRGNKDTDHVYLYPLNALETNECSEWSSNPENNKFYSSKYYMGIITDYALAYLKEKTINQANAQEQGTQAAIPSINMNTIAEPYRKNQKDYRPVYATNKSKNAARPFDLNDETSPYYGGFVEVQRSIRERFENTADTGKLIIRSIALSHFITHTGTRNGTVVTVDGKRYNIRKKDFKTYNNRFLREGRTDLSTEGLAKVEPDIANIINEARKIRSKNGTIPYVNNAFEITPVSEVINMDVEDSNITEIEEEEATEDIMSSTAVELSQLGIRTINRNAQTNEDSEASRLSNYLRDQNITSEKSVVEAHLETAIRVNAEYVSKTVDNLLKDLNYFIQDEEGNWHSITSDTALEAIMQDKDTKNRFLKTMLDARALVKNFAPITELDIEAEDERDRQNLRLIRDKIKTLETASIIKQAEEEFARKYLQKLSNNPLIQNDYLSLLDGYHSASAFDAWVNDLQETSSPLIQIISKEVMKDIRAKEMRAQELIRNFRKNVERIKAKGTIRWDKIIDENGKFVQDYAEAFVEEIERLRKRIEELKDSDPYSLEHLKAIREYRIFKLNFTHQALVDRYYEELLNAEKPMIETYTTIYSEYMKLEARKREILSHERQGVLEPSLEDELKKVNDQINALTSDFWYDSSTGEYILKSQKEVSSNKFPAGSRESKLYSSASANALNRYLKARATINKKYFSNDSTFGWKEDLDRYLRIIEENEASHKTEAELMRNEDYVKAKEWIAHNTRFVLDSETQTKINQAFADLKEAKQGRSLLSELARKADAYDNFGVIDGKKLSDQAIANIKKEQERSFKIRSTNPFNDRILISNAPEDDTIFKKEFYNGMRSNGVSNPDYLRKVAEINDILSKCYDPLTRTADTTILSEAELNKLEVLYEELEDIKAHHDTTNARAIKKFIRKHVEFVVNQTKFDLLRQKAHAKGNLYENAWLRANAYYEDGEWKPNKKLYGYAIPKGYKSDGTGDNTYVDQKLTNAHRVIKDNTQTVVTEYYYKKYAEMKAKTADEFNDWYEKNHIFNPYTHRMEPLQCWTTLSPKDTNNSGQYKPTFKQSDRRIKDGRLNEDYELEPDFVNHDYKGGTTASNFKKSYQPSADAVEYYDNRNFNRNNDLTDAELEMRDLFQFMLRSMTNTIAGNRWLDKGYMAMRSKAPETDAKFYFKELLKFIGWVDNSVGRESWRYDESVDYSKDTVEDMPMLHLLRSKESIDFKQKEPKRTDFATDEEFNDAISKYREAKEEAEKKNAEIHRNLMDNNWVEVMEEFIRRAAHFNAIQDNKYMLYYGKNMIDRLDVYKKTLGFANYKIQDNTDPNNPIYVTSKDTNLQKQYVNWIRRLIYDQWKEPNNKFTRVANTFQNFTSSKFMMLNITGGIANVNVGDVNILGEIFAKEYFDHVAWLKGKATYSTGLVSYFADRGKEKATSLPSAIIKFFNVVDYDELSGVVSVKSKAEWMKRIRDDAFAPLAMGEHLMQNGALLTMMHSHRLIKVEDPMNPGHTTYKICNEAEVKRDAHEAALLAVLNDREREAYDRFIKRETRNANQQKEYMWFRKDFTTQFANIYLRGQYEKLKQFRDKKKELEKAAQEEFEKNPTLMEQCELGEDGMLSFKEGSILWELNNQDAVPNREDFANDKEYLKALKKFNDNPNRAYELLGEFKGRVISVNKKIHGNYGKLDAAMLESKLLGGIAMQYHKHIYPGLMKRYRRQGYFNEERGTVEKGCYAALKDFLALPLQQKKFINALKEDGVEDADLNAISSIQNLMRNYVEFATHINLYWNTLPEHDKANIRRALADYIGVFSAICFAIALQCIAGDDDDHGMLYNLCMYECDRLASEAFMFNPIGIYAEGKKLWSSPTAVQTSISDTFATLGLISQYIIQGEDFDPYYSNGLYSGENKFEVLIRRNIPIYHSMYMLQRLNKNNKYYKLETNMLGFVPIKDWARAIRHSID